MIEKAFTIVSVESVFNGVFIYLKPSEPFIIPSTPLERVLTPEPETDDEKAAKQMVQTIMKEMRKVLPMDVISPTHHPFIVRVHLTQREYEELDKPTVGATIKIQLQIPKEGEGVEGKSSET